MGVANTDLDVDAALSTITPVFQPVLWLDDLSLAGFESLARGPEGSRLRMPQELFDAARARGLVGALDAAMTKATLETVLATPWDRSITLFANVEPEAMMTPPPPDTIVALERAERLGLRVVVEITERSLLDSPASLMASTRMARSRGWGVAMDDVGRDDDTLTLLSVIRPDVVKVDMSILHGEFDSHASRVSSTVRSYCDRTGAWMLCEGIETAAHEMRARALGADLVQGFRYAHPDSLPELIAPVLRPIELRGIGVDEPQPFRDVIAQIPTAHLPGDRVQQMASELVAIASSHTDAAVVLLSAPSANDVPTTYLDALAELAEKACVVALIAPGSEPNPRPGVTGVDADATSDLGCPWSVTAIAPAMAATILTDPFGGDPTDPVEHRVIHDRSTVAHAARVLLALVSSTAAP